MITSLHIEVAMAIPFSHSAQPYVSFNFYTSQLIRKDDSREDPYHSYHDRAVEIRSSEIVTIDNYRLAATPPGTKCQIRRFRRKSKSFLFGKEEIVLEVKDPTRLII